jgi:general secretion pathway protein G
MIVSQMLSNRQQSQRRAAFTLLEVLVVVAIIIVLAGIATVYVPKYLEDSYKNRAVIDCKTLANVVSSQYMQTGEYPQNLQDVAGYVQGGIPASPWGGQYALSFDESTGQTRVVVSTTAKDGTVITNYTK